MRKNALSGEVQTRSNDETLNKRHLHILPLAPPGEDAPAVAGRDACATGRDKMASMSEFSPPWWLRNAHAQTVWGRLARSRQLVRFRREVLRTPDDDDLIVDHLDAPSPRVHFILMHGLEGSTYSVYIQGLLSIIERHGQSATAINFRSCARDPRRIGNDLPNRRPRLYHSGE